MAQVLIGIVLPYLIVKTVLIWNRYPRLFHPILETSNHSPLNKTTLSIVPISEIVVFCCDSLPDIVKVILGY